MNTSKVVPAMLLVALILPSVADARPDTRSMTCKQLQSFIMKNGAVVMNTGPRTYNRFVYHRGFCLYSERVGTAWVNASDGECRLQECKQPRIQRDDSGF